MNLLTVVERSLEPLTDELLARLADRVPQADLELCRVRPDLSGFLQIAVLAQGAAAHRVRPDADVGAKDLDVWVCYRKEPAVRDAPPRRRKTYDFGPSLHGRHPADRGFRGRRIDVLARSTELPPGRGPAKGLRRWIRGTTQSAVALRAKPMVVLWPRERLGEVVWHGDAAPTRASKGYTTPLPSQDPPSSVPFASG